MRKFELIRHLALLFVVTLKDGRILRRVEANLPLPENKLNIIKPTRSAAPKQ